MNDINKCWESAFKLIQRGQEEEAISVCESEPCASRSPECQKYLGWIYYRRDEYENASLWFSKAYESGDSEGIYGLANISFVQGDYELARENYLVALQEGCTRANYWLGVIYEHGLGVKKSVQKAKEYYSDGAKCGYLISARALVQTVFRYGSLWEKLLAIPDYVRLVAKGFKVASGNASDERLADVPNPFNRG
jgi:TPR repeat protein